MNKADRKKKKMFSFAKLSLKSVEEKKGLDKLQKE